MEYNEDRQFDPIFPESEEPSVPNITEEVPETEDLTFTAAGFVPDDIPEEPSSSGGGFTFTPTEISPQPDRATVQKISNQHNISFITFVFFITILLLHLF